MSLTMDADEDCWIVVDKTAGGELRAKGSHESMYAGADHERARVHMQNRSGGLAPELVEWIHNAAQEGAPKSPFRTNSSSVGNRQRSATMAGSDASSVASHDSDMFNEGTFIAKIVEVRLRGASRAMNLQCVAQVGDEKLAIAPVGSRLVEPGVWASRLNDTFVFDVARGFTFNLCVYGTLPAQPRAMLPHRMSLRHSLARNSIAVSTMSNTSLASAGSTRASAKIKRGLRKIFRNRPDEGDADDPAYCGVDAAADEGNPAVQTGVVLTERQTDDYGRALEVQHHAGESAASSRHGSFAQDAPGLVLPLHLQPPPAQPQQQQQLPLHQHPAISRLSSYLPRSRTSTVVSAHEIGYNGPRLRAFSNAASVGGTPAPQALGELYLDLKVDRREKRRATFTLPAINQEQVMMRGGAHVELEVIMEYGIMVHETCEERVRRQQQEQEQRRAATAAAMSSPEDERRQRVERQWAAVDEQDRQPRLRGHLSVFTRNGRVSTWRRYWAVLCPTRILFYDNEADETRGAVPVKMSLFHMHRAGAPETDLVSVGPTGIELHLSPLAMTDRHRRKSAFPRPQQTAADVRRDAARHAMPDVGGLTLTPRRVHELSAMLPDLDDATLEMYKDWHCRVYLLMDTMDDRARWLQELKVTCVPSCEFARFRTRQRGKWRTQDFEAAAASLRTAAAAAVEELTPKFHAPALPPADGGNSSDEELEGATLTSISGLRNAAPARPPRKPVAFGKPGALGKPAALGKPVLVVEPAAKPMAFGKPATFDIVVSAADSTVRLPAPPAKKKIRAGRRRSSSVGDLRAAVSPPPASVCTLARRDSAASMLVEVVGKAVERRPGTVSRRFLFVWNASDI